MATEASPAETHRRIAESAQSLDASAQHQLDSADQRTRLAADRTVLAAERTYAAWMRTGLTALAAGVGARALLDKLVPPSLAIATASVLVLASGFCYVAAVWREALNLGPELHPTTKRLPVSLLVAVSGFLLLVSFAALVGIWRS